MWERERRSVKWLFDSAAPAASSLLGSFSPFVSTDQLPQTEGLEPGGVGWGSSRRHVDGKGWCWERWGGWGDVFVIGHTFCHPGGTFQLLLLDDDVSAPAGPRAISIPVLSGMSHVDAIISDLQPVVDLVLLQSHQPKFVLIWTSLALSPNAIQMLVAFKGMPYPTSLRVFSVSYQLWFSLRLMTQLDLVSCDQSAGMRALVQTRQSPKILKGCGESRGMHQRQKIFMAGKAVTTSLERQTICFSEGDCNIDAVFIRLIIAKHRSIQIFSCLLGCVWNLRVLKYFRSLLKKQENNKSKFCSA